MDTHVISENAKQINCEQDSHINRVNKTQLDASNASRQEQKEIISKPLCHSNIPIVQDKQYSEIVSKNDITKDKQYSEIVSKTDNSKDSTSIAHRANRCATPANDNILPQPTSGHVNTETMQNADAVQISTHISNQIDRIQTRETDRGCDTYTDDTHGEYNNTNPWNRTPTAWWQVEDRDNHGEYDTMNYEEQTDSDEPIFESCHSGNNRSTGRRSIDKRSNQHSSPDEPIFESVKSRRTQRYYIGGIDRRSNKAGLAEFLDYYKITPAASKLIITQRDALAAKVTVYQDQCAIMDDKTIWRGKMYCRKWMSENRWKGCHGRTHTDSRSYKQYQNDE